MYVNNFFALNSRFVSKLHNFHPKFGYDGFGEIVFYRTYSRIKSDGGQENWHDVVIRSINGTMSIRKDWYVRNFINWDEDYWQLYAYNMALSMFRMYWLPAGRGMWAMGTNFVYERGSMALNNCGYTLLGNSERLGNDIHWMLDALMLGVGVGFEPVRDDLRLYKPIGTYYHFVKDSREGWADSEKLMVEAFTQPQRRLPIFKYDHVRGPGLPIKGFGGLSSGPAPLEQLHKETQFMFELALRGGSVYNDPVRLKTDLGNKAGVCVVAGNVRRSAELCKGKVTDKVFMNLKDYELNPDREDWGYMSNNSVALSTDEDFESLGEVARRVIIRGEPGIMNLRNFKTGRVGKPTPVRDDLATGLNPCGEIPLEDKELCNVVETLPTVCPNVDTWYKACEYATFYASTVSLLPTHRPETNRVVMRNRRIGVSIIDWTGWVLTEGVHKVTKYMRKGYEVVTNTNRGRNSEAGVPESIRKTTIKPGGTGPKLPGRTPGIGYPTFTYTLRRMRVAANNPICPVLDAAGISFEPDYFDPLRTRVYEFPMVQGPAAPADKISLWEQAMNLVTVQREWSDNAVSNTLYFKPKWKLLRFRSSDKVEEVAAEIREAQIIAKRRFMRAAAILNYHALDTDDINKESQVAKANDAIEKNGFVDPGWKDNDSDDDFKFTLKQNKYGTWELKLYKFDPNHEEDQIERVLSSITPLIKSCSLLPHSDEGAYRQMPEEGITKQEYETRLAKIKPIDWTLFKGSDGEDEKYCSGPVCAVALPTS